MCFYACSQEGATQGSEDTKQVCVFELVLQSGVAIVILIINFAYSICMYHVFVFLSLIRKECN